MIGDLLSYGVDTSATQWIIGEFADAYGLTWQSKEVLFDKISYFGKSEDEIQQLHK